MTIITKWNNDRWLGSVRHSGAFQFSQPNTFIKNNSNSETFLCLQEEHLFQENMFSCRLWCVCFSMLENRFVFQFFFVFIFFFSNEMVTNKSSPLLRAANEIPLCRFYNKCQNVMFLTDKYLLFVSIAEFIIHSRFYPAVVSPFFPTLFLIAYRNNASK